MKSEDNTDPDPLVLRVGADGTPPSQNLWLSETDHFSGRYEGFLRLTDADGNGGGTDWGLMTKDATGSSMEAGHIAVIAVESGAVTITYKNSVGDVRTVSIQIDKEPPTIQIDSPAHNTASKDDSPELLGSFSDGGSSGLREDSFKIYADNREGEKNDSRPVWDLRGEQPRRH